MSELIDFEGRPSENLVRTSVSADLGALFLTSVSDPNKRQVLEEAIVALSHDMIEVGQTLGREAMEDAVQGAYYNGLNDARSNAYTSYLFGMADAMDLAIKGRESNGNSSEE
jgi:hypothetical protein